MYVNYTVYGIINFKIRHKPLILTCNHKIHIRQCIYSKYPNVDIFHKVCNTVFRVMILISHHFLKGKYFGLLYFFKYSKYALKGEVFWFLN